MLTETERVALERLRDESASSHLDDEQTVINAMLRLFPPGHDAEITPERLVACGGKEQFGYITWGGLNAMTGQWKVTYLPDSGWWSCAVAICPTIAPRNMGEVMQLLARCGIAVTKGGD